jgi:predicted RNase H-like nuclease
MEDQRLDIANSDDRLDALVCALVARAAAKNCTELAETPDHQALAQIEGWSHLPNRAAFSA